jgi:hypothetical protein
MERIEHPLRPFLLDTAAVEPCRTDRDEYRQVGWPFFLRQSLEFAFEPFALFGKTVCEATRNYLVGNDKVHALFDLHRVHRGPDEEARIRRRGDEGDFDVAWQRLEQLL